MASRTRSKGSMAQLTGTKEVRESSSRSRLFFIAVFGSSISRGSSTQGKSKTSQRSSAMRVACTQNDVKRLRALLAEPGCDPNAADATGTTPLLIAAKLGHADCCRELLENGANVGPSSNGSSSGSKSRNRNHSSNNDSGNANQLFSSINALPLEEAAKAGHAKAVEALLAGGALIDARNHIGNTALHFACMKGHVNVVRCLLEAGANHALVNLSNNTPLSLAARHGSAGVCAVLVEHDVDLNVGNSLGTNPLATACRYGHREVVEWLLAAPSVRVDAADDAGFTALHEASREGHLNIVVELLRAHAFPVPRSYADGATPLHEACREGHIDLARELLMAAATYAHKTSGVHRKSKSASRNGGVGGSNGLAHSKFSDDNLFGPNPLDYRGNTPLHDACREGHADICSDLLAAGADQTIVNENGLTPLQEAQAGGHADCTNVLESDAVDEREFRKKTKSRKFKVRPLPNEHQLSPVEPYEAPPDLLNIASKTGEAIAHAATSLATQLDPFGASTSGEAAAAAAAEAAAAKAKACGGGGAHVLPLQVMVLEGACDANVPFLVRAACADAMCLEIGQVTCGKPFVLEQPEDRSSQQNNSVAALEVCIYGLPSAATLSQVRAVAIDSSSSGLTSTLDMIGLGTCRVSVPHPSGNKIVHAEAKKSTETAQPVNNMRNQRREAAVVKKKAVTPATPLPPPSAPRDGNSRNKTNQLGQSSALSPVAKRLDFFDDDDVEAETLLAPKSSARSAAPQGSALDGIISPNVSLGRIERGSESEEEQELLDQIMASFNGSSSAQAPPAAESQARSKPKTSTKATPANSQSRSANADKSSNKSSSRSNEAGALKGFVMGTFSGLGRGNRNGGSSSRNGVDGSKGASYGKDTAVELDGQLGGFASILDDDEDLFSDHVTAPLREPAGSATDSNKRQVPPPSSTHQPSSDLINKADTSAGTIEIASNSTTESMKLNESSRNSGTSSKSKGQATSSRPRNGDVSSSCKSGSKSEGRRAVSPTKSPALPPTKLHRAARSNDISQLKKLLAPLSSSSLSPSSSTPRGAKSPPSSSGKTNAEVDPNARCGRKGLTPLMECAMRGFAEATSVLIAHGADRDLRDFIDGSTALDLAMLHRREDVVGVLTAPQVTASLSVQPAATSPTSSRAVAKSKREGTAASSSSIGRTVSGKPVTAAPPAPILPAVQAAASATSLLAARVAAARAAARPHSPTAELLIGGGGLLSRDPLSGLALVDDKPSTRPPPSAAALAAAAAAREAAAAAGASAEVVEWAGGSGDVLSGPQRSAFTPANRLSSPRASSPRASSPRASSPRTATKVPKPRSRSPRGGRPAPAYSEWTGKSIFSAVP